MEDFPAEGPGEEERGSMDETRKPTHAGGTAPPGPGRPTPSRPEKNPVGRPGAGTGSGATEAALDLAFPDPAFYLKELAEREES